MKVCPNCGSSSVRPAKQVDDWASIEEQMDSGSSDKYECDECGYKGELIGVQEVPEEDEMEEEEPELEEKPVVVKKVKKQTKKIKSKKR